MKQVSAKLKNRGATAAVLMLALGAAACWAVYSILLRRMGGRHDPLLVTRRTLFWAVTATSAAAPWPSL